MDLTVCRVTAETKWLPTQSNGKDNFKSCQEAFSEVSSIHYHVSL